MWRTAVSWALAPRATRSRSGPRARSSNLRGSGATKAMANSEHASRRSGILRKHGDQMEVREIKALLVLMRDYGLVELEIEDKKGKVRLVRGGARASVDETEASSAEHLPARVATSIKMASARRSDYRG